ncbi:MAG TPA: DegT/DnrJ/EryC1/StrS family aminotransferase [Microbacteriaceae bacterium]|jgi:dTDP-4-amino-4,6-dideoxygalactose transaminase|nr:DegT/DnrJ/EryC1/StrS family aminotransferase [Microbacteriaceae bacterium]
MTAIPFLDLAAQQAEIMDEIEPLVLETLRTAHFVGGPRLDTFEAEYAAFVGTSHCIGAGNGTDAIELILRACNISAGDEVILPANTFIATAEAVVRAGATVVLADVDPVSLLLSPDSVAAAATSRTRAVIPVHLYGQMAPVEKIIPIADALKAIVIEDAAQSQGARRYGVGSGAAGAAAATSFYPGKNLGAAGDAGAITTNDDVIADRVRTIGAHGSKVKYVHEVIGLNSRLDALQAIVLSAKLRRLNIWNERRRVAAARYEELLRADHRVTTVPTLEGNVHAWHLFVVQVDNRDVVLERLARAGVGAAIHYPTPIHLTEAFAHLGLAPGSFPVAEAAAGRILSLPMFPHITVGQQEKVVAALSSALDG